jgi:hypothetical protein
MVREYLAWATEQPDIHDTFTEAQMNMKAVGVLREVRHRDHVRL